ncbi:macrophage mannose receptor 1-like [Nothobranchius furzeri]|uniref:C-type lectin domain-containing protein n=1 Tax=Nothobranchius furzeri TaxID=105023 RepID=A0A8C6KPG7_NOTFU|nr:macrophage mannose receptor 1-like [Nothobranchius furzeri]XP_054595638.1 macrophage mannose receptor 1-like [Nothobranchius furzeri]
MATIKPILMLVLFSGLMQSVFAANRLRYFSNVTEILNFTAAQNKCDENGGSLVTLYDQEDADFVLNLTKSIGDDNHSSYWLGLYKNLSANATWSNGDPFNGPGVHLEGGKQICMAIGNGTWMNFSCSDRKPFMCQKGKNYSLIEEEKNWCQALQYCRTHYTDLASVNTTRHDEELKQENTNKTYWIGLMHDEWKWDDNSCSTYRNEANIALEPNSSYSILSWTTGFLWKSGERASLLCTKGHVRIKVINEPKTWEAAIEYCKAHHTRLLWIEDQEDQKAVEQWLRHTPVSGYTKSFWIALKQSSVFGFWIWSDRIVNWNNWKDGTMPEAPLSEQCGVMDAGSFKWRDENCWHRLSFLCEEEIFYMDK